jgi:hypothetical protein
MIETKPVLGTYPLLALQGIPRLPNNGAFVSDRFSPGQIYRLKPENRCLVPSRPLLSRQQAERRRMVWHRQRAPGHVRGSLSFRIGQHPKVEGWKNHG